MSPKTASRDQPPQTIKMNDRVPRQTQYYPDRYISIDSHLNRAKIAAGIVLNRVAVESEPPAVGHTHRGFARV
jgi:hypothetical protein